MKLMIFIIIIILSQNSETSSTSMYSKCLDTQVYCMSLPETCVQQNMSCNILLTATPVTDGSVQFELMGRVDQSNRWFAMGLSFDSEMGSDSVTEIFISNDAKHKAMRQSWNEGHSNEVLAKVDGITQIGDIIYSDGFLYGKWQRSSVTTVRETKFDIMKNKFYILLAQGSLDENNNKQYHNNERASESKVDLQSLPKDALNELYTKCNTTEMLCFGYPDNCIPSKNCELISGITSGGYGLMNGTVEFQMIGKAGKGKDIDQWIALGLSDDNKMGNDSVVECVVFKNGTTKFRDSWNWSGGRTGNDVIDDVVGVVSSGNVSYDNGLISCKWSRLPYTKVKGTTYDIVDNKYYVLLAKGKLANEETGQKQYHNEKRTVSEASVNLQLDRRQFSSSTTTEKTKTASTGTTESTRTSTEIPSSLTVAYDRCSNKERLCFGLPAKCIDSRNCIVLFSSLSVSKFTGQILIELFWSRDSSQNDRWVGLGLSDDKLMGDDSVTECILRDNSSVSIKQGWNPSNHNPTENVKVSGITPIDSSYINGIVYCKWSRDGMTSVMGNTFNILNNTYYLMLAYGPMSSDDSMGKHRDKVISDTPIDLQSVGVVEASGLNIFIKLHGTFMVIAWLGCVSTAIIMARHYKNAWPKTTLYGLKIWFVIHRALMVISIVFIILATIMIVLYRKGWSGGTAHPILGVIAISLAILQPIGAMFRPGPNASNRWIFNWAHWFVGNTALIISFITIILASNFTNVVRSQFVWVMVAYIICYVISHLLHHLKSYLLERDYVTGSLFVKNQTFETIQAALNSFFIAGFVAALIILIVV